MGFNNNCNFEKASELIFKTFSYEELIELMQRNNIAEKQFAILSLEEIKSEQDGNMLCSNLVGQDGKIREATAFKLNELFKNNTCSKYLENTKNFSTMLEGLMDINGNVCRNILEIDNEKFSDYLSNTIINRLNLILEEVSKLNSTDKQYVISKRNFQLYWALEGLYKVVNKFSFPEIKDLLYKSAAIEDYTIKEKVAKIIKEYPTDKAQEVQELKSLLKHSNNYFVQRYI